ncbi:MAG: 4Fe-4S dicluster domain-containing protein [Chloroflexota bacterium]|nr:4Fe-4S dicluster domain-containing protein [Chloroflexota bacterium]
MIINVIPEKCTGCRACEVFCPLEQEGIIDPALSRIQVLKDVPNNIFLPVLCPPCEDKACMTACPEPGAMVIESHTGAVVIVEELCTACSKCIAACDIGAIQFLRQPGRGKNDKAVAIKCNQCGGDPWCVKVCEPGALEYVEESDTFEGQIVFETLRTSLDNAGAVLEARGLRQRRRVRVK